MLIPNWDGEDDRFDVTDLSDITLVRNVERLSVISMVHVNDYSPLFKLGRLKGIGSWSDLRGKKRIVSKLRKKGVLIY